MSEYLDLAKRVVEAASASGRDVEVYISRDRELTVQMSRGQVEKLSQSGSHGMGVRVIQDGKMGYAYTADLSEESVERTWRAAVELSEVATPDEYRALPDPEPIPDEDLQIYDPQLEALSVEDKIAFLKKVEETTLNYDPRIIATTFTQYFDGTTSVYMANSRGFVGEYSRTGAGSFLFAVARGEDGGMVNAPGFGAATHWQKLDPEMIGREAAEKTLSILGGSPVPTQTASVVLDYFVGAQILAALAMAMTAEAMQRKRSFLLDKLGQTVASDMVTLMDNGRLPGGFGSAPFDGEGVPTSATRLIDEGVFQNVIYDSYTARKAGKRSTGNAQRNGHQSLPRLAPSNFYMQPGQLSRQDIIKGVEKGLFVISVMQTGGIDPVTGDCSMGANGVWIENGEFVGPVGGVTIATTLGDLLKNITQVGNDLRMVPVFGNIGVPTLRVDNVTIGGT